MSTHYPAQPASVRWHDLLRRGRQAGRPLVAASILSADFGRMAEECEQVFGLGVDLLHIDVMDGHFVPNLTMGADMIAALRRGFPDAVFDVHLMVERPADFVESFARAGTDMFTFHVERICGDEPAAEPVSAPSNEQTTFHVKHRSPEPNQAQNPHFPAPPTTPPMTAAQARSLIAQIRQAGMLVGMAVNPPTDVTAMTPWLSQLDLALVMSVNPGRSGQAFMPEVLQKARWLASELPPECAIEIDGGISPATAPQATAAGVEVLVSASALFGAEDRKAAIEALRNAGRPARRES